MRDDELVPFAFSGFMRTVCRSPSGKEVSHNTDRIQQEYGIPSMPGGARSAVSLLYCCLRVQPSLLTGWHRRQTKR